MADRRSLVWRRRVRTLALTIVVLAAVRWCALEAMSLRLHGVVVDGSTGRPVAGAIVVAHRGTSDFFAGRHRRLQIAEAQTDGEGRYRLRLRSRELQIEQIGLGGYRDFFVVAKGYDPLAVSARGFEGPDPWPQAGSDGLPVVRLNPRTGPITVEELAVVGRPISQMYSFLPAVCREVELPMLLAYLRDARAYVNAEAIDKRKWDIRNDCVN